MRRKYSDAQQDSEWIDLIAMNLPIFWRQSLYSDLIQRPSLWGATSHNPFFHIRPIVLIRHLETKLFIYSFLPSISPWIGMFSHQDRFGILLWYWDVTSLSATILQRGCYYSSQSFFLFSSSPKYLEQFLLKFAASRFALRPLKISGKRDLLLISSSFQIS